MVLIVRLFYIQRLVQKAFHFLSARIFMNGKALRSKVNT